MERTCGNCSCWNRLNELLGACTGDILKTGSLRDCRDAAAGCRFWRARFPEMHLRYRKLIADYYFGCKNPFLVRAFCTDGHVYEADPKEVMRCRCAKWTKTDYSYVYDETKYRQEIWTETPDGTPSSGMAIVTNEEKMIG